MIVDYYAVLSRAIATLEDNTAEVRQKVYERAWQLLAERLAQASPPPADADMRAEQSAFDDAVRRIEGEFLRGQHLDAPTLEPAPPATFDDAPTDAVRELRRAPWQSSRLVLVSALAAALVIAIFGIGYFAASSMFFRSESKGPAKRAAAVTRPANSNALVKDPAPGFDGGSSYPHLPFYYRRQPVYYRTTHPASTIVIDKAQHFLYLVQSETVALRYGVAMGEECPAARGLHLVARKQEWPAWRPSAVVSNVRTVPASMQGGPGNPLGAALLSLNTETDRIHGTNAPSTIGRDMLFGCVRLANDDIVDLYKRVAVGSRVIITN